MSYDSDEFITTHNEIMAWILGKLIDVFEAQHQGQVHQFNLTGTAGFFQLNLLPVGDMPKNSSSQYGLKAQEYIDPRGIRVTNGPMRYKLISTPYIYEGGARGRNPVSRATS